MRTSLLAILVSWVSTSLFGQGEISFNNSGASAEQKIYVGEWLNPAALAPGGGQFLVALYFARMEDGESFLTQVGDAVGLLGTADQRYGLFFGGNRTVPTTVPGSHGMFQVKGWEAAYGNTYEEASTDPLAKRGSSPVFVAVTKDPALLGPSPNLVNGSAGSGSPFRGFVIAIPEPSTAVLALVGVVTIALVVRCRRA